MNNISNSALIELTAEIASAYVGNNKVGAEELSTLIASIHEALSAAVAPETIKAAALKMPAVSVRKSVTEDYLICLEDGRRFKSLKRHLQTKYNLSPEDYRAKWELPNDYPMVAPSYAKTRSLLAKQIGLGQGTRSATTVKGRARRGRKPAAAPAAAE